MGVRVVNVRGLNAPEQRAGVCYVGRAFAGWPVHPLHNPFRPNVRTFDTDTKKECADERARAVAACIEEYRYWLFDNPTLEDELRRLWEACERGAKPLGCWCVNAEVGDGQPCVCHAQVLAAELHKRFVKD